MKFNNLKQIREIYGATQEQIARALSVNRVTVANWESGSTVASNANREKMSIYYGIGPEFFYEQELSEDAKQQILRTAEKERNVVKQSDGHKNKQEDFERMFHELSFDKAMRDYMMSMKILLAKVDDADLETLRILLKSWYVDRNDKQRGVEWHFTTSDARNKLKHLYPVINI